MQYGKRTKLYLARTNHSALFCAHEQLLQDYRVSSKLVCKLIVWQKGFYRWELIVCYCYIDHLSPNFVLFDNNKYLKYNIMYKLSDIQSRISNQCSLPCHAREYTWPLPSKVLLTRSFICLCLCQETRTSSSLKNLLSILQKFLSFAFWNHWVGVPS